MTNEENDNKSNISLSLKDLIYSFVLLGSIISSHYTIESKTRENNVKIEMLSAEVNRERIANDKLRNDVVEVKSIVMEIKGYLKQN